MKKILVPCDFSQQARAAFKTALNFASKSNGKITLLHVLNLPYQYATSIGGELMAYEPVFLTRVEEDAKDELNKMKLQAAGKSVDVLTEVTFGDMVNTVINVAERDQVDVIIMGTSGTSGLSELFIGSNTEKVVRHSPVPVLAIKNELDVMSVKNILLPSALTLNQTEFINKVKELQEFFNATLNVLLINTPTHFRRDNEAIEALAEFAKHYQLKNYKTHFRSYLNEEEGISYFAHTEHMDIIAMATHSRRGLAHLFNVSITEGVVNHVMTPVWTYTLKNKEERVKNTEIISEEKMEEHLESVS